MRRILVVREIFDVQGKGVILGPSVRLPGRRRRELTVELRRPDGTVLHSEATASLPFTHPPRPPRSVEHLLVVKLTESDVPVGTEVWVNEQEGDARVRADDPA